MGLLLDLLDLEDEEQQSQTAAPGNALATVGTIHGPPPLRRRSRRRIAFREAISYAAPLVEAAVVAAVAVTTRAVVAVDTQHAHGLAVTSARRIADATTHRITSTTAAAKRAAEEELLLLLLAIEGDFCL